MRAPARLLLVGVALAASARGGEVAAQAGGGGAVGAERSEQAAIVAAREGGTILLCRHAKTDSFQEREPVDYDDPSTQRRLDGEGEDQSRRIGAALARVGVRVGVLVASPMHRSHRTAELMLGRPPRIDSIWHTNGSDYSGHAREARLRALAEPVPADNTLIVSHIGTMSSVVPEARGAVGEGDCVVVRPMGTHHEVIGIVAGDGWMEATIPPARRRAGLSRPRWGPYDRSKDAGTQTEEDAMSLSRRGFVRTAGLGAAGALSIPFITGRGSEAAAFEPRRPQSLDDAIIKISSNENARGPGASAIAAIEKATTARMGRGYPPDHREELVATIAESFGVEQDHVLVGTGSGVFLEAGPRAFCAGGGPLVTAAPSYASPESTARRIGAEVRSSPVDGSLALDLDAMAAAARGAGMVFLCNPNNPTGTAYSAGVVEDFVRQVKRTSPETAILVDEAYVDYAYDPAVSSVAHLAVELPGVFVTRTLSKAHGMAGLRVGYAIGQPETLGALERAWGLGSMNTLSAAAAIASIRDTGHLEAERRENARIRDFVRGAFDELGYPTPDTHANFVFVDLGMPAATFRDACLEHGVQVGRDFPPMETTHCRVSLGTMEEMERSVEVFRGVLS